MADFSFKQGEDKKVSIGIVKNGVAVDLTTAINIKAILKVNSAEQKKYALTAETGFGTLEVDGTITNQVNIFVQREETKGFPVGNITVILLISFVDTDFTDGERVEELKFNVGRVSLGEGIDETMP